VHVNGERNGRLYIQNYSMRAAFIDDGSKAEDFTGGIKEMETWIKAVLGEGELVVKPEQAYMVSCILEAIYKSALSVESSILIEFIKIITIHKGHYLL